MKKNKIFYLIVFTGVMMVMVTACSKKMDSSINNETNSDAGTTSAQPNYVESKLAQEDVAIGAEERLTNTSAFTTNDTLLNAQDKIIQRVNLEAETQDFDNLIKTIDTQINQLGGYVESSNTSGRKYGYSNDMRYGNIVARVPKEKLDEFINAINDNSNVVNKEVATENVTLQYVETQSHKKALEIEQERLLALLEKVETLEDIITLETRLSSVRYELESYESQLRTYDNLVEYSTITLSIQEVERMTSLIEDKKTVWNRIKTGFGNSMYNVGEGLKNFFVWFIVNIPYLIIWAVLITTGVLIRKRYYKKKILKNILMNQTPTTGQNHTEDKK